MGQFALKEFEIRPGSYMGPPIFKNMVVNLEQTTFGEDEAGLVVINVGGVWYGTTYLYSKLKEDFALMREAYMDVCEAMLDGDYEEDDND